MDSSSERYSPKEIETRLVKDFLDILILVEMKKRTCLTGYDVIDFVNKKFGDMLSPGTVYSTIYSIERKGFIKGDSNGRKTVYKLTSIGNDVLTRIKDSRQEMTQFMETFFC
jgi:DNA-binding PadR family transcriptional regulator